MLSHQKAVGRKWKKEERGGEEEGEGEEGEGEGEGESQ